MSPVKSHPGALARQAAWHRAQAEGGPEEQRGDHEAKAERIESELSRLGRCRRCGRTLSDPASVADGLGRDCKARLERQTS